MPRGGRLRNFEGNVKRSFNKVVENIQEFSKRKQKGRRPGGTDTNFWKKTNVIKVIDCY
jgi:hypothetical protein